MLNEKDLQATAALIQRDFELENLPEGIPTEEELFDLLSDRIAWLLEYRLEFLLSLMYRLDVSEAKVNAALAPDAPEPANVGLARLVWERQLRRQATKRAYPPDDLGEDFWG